MKKILGILLVGTMALSAGAETLAYWDFSSDPQGVLDCSGNGNTLTNEGVRIVNGAAEFDGTARVFRTLAPVNFNKAYSYTVEFFARSDSDAASQCLIELSSSINLCPNAFFFFSKDGLMTRPNGYNGEKFKSCPAGDGQWHHYAGIFVPSGTSNLTEQVQFYVDGVRQDQYTEHQAPNVCLCAAYPLYIGSRGNQEYLFEGAIDDIRITRGVLAPADFLQTRTTNTALDVVCYYPFNHDNCWCTDPEGLREYMPSVKQPWIAFKVLGAGAIHPREGFPYAFNNGADAICVGMFDFQMVENVNLVNKIFEKGLPQRTRAWN